MKTQSMHVSECGMDDYATGRECAAIMDWRASVRNAGAGASIDEVKDLLAKTPACLATHGTHADHTDLHLLMRAAATGVPALDL
ncbi:hypothetical protein [Acidiferrobacter sp.]